ncbi:MAG: C1 family peptidase [Bacteroidota bacterium]
MNTLKIFFPIVCFLSINTGYGQDKQEDVKYEFEIIRELETLPVENQYMTNTCWSFTSLAMIESELIREGKGKVNLSEMYVVRNVYLEKAIRYVRMHGNIQFSGGGALNDVPDIIKKYGIVPHEVYTGLKNGNKNHVHIEMDSILLSFVDNLVKNDTIPFNWLKEYNKILDQYLGKVPENFKYKGKKYTPISYMEYLNINPDNYLLLSSFSHHPFYDKFILEVPDNWSWGQACNLPMEELVQVIEHALETGYTVAWAGDITEEGFSWFEGIAVIPSGREENLFKTPIKEKEFSRESRQLDFDSYLTTDDHGMLIIGVAREKSGGVFFYTKNSWGTQNKQDGYMFLSESFIKHKTLSILVNKNAIPKHLLEKM